MLNWDHWLDQARSARRTAALAHEAGEYAWGCFLYQQAAEMALKGALERLGRDHQGHSVIALLNDFPGDVGGEEVRAAARRLTRLYIPTRYPDAAGTAPSELYVREDAEKAAADADRLIEMRCGSWSARMRPTAETLASDVTLSGYLSWLERTHGPSLDFVVLYGSRARGAARGGPTTTS